MPDYFILTIFPFMKLFNLFFKLLIPVSSCIGSFPLSAQDIFINKIEERRSTSTGFFSNECEVYFTIKNLGENLQQYVRFSEVSKAVDSKGNTLIDDGKIGKNYKKASDSDLKLELLSPAREAASIRELTGILSFFTPSEKNGSIVIVPGFAAKSDQNLLPGSAPVTLVYLSEEMIKKKAEEVKKMQQEELDKLDDTARELAQNLLSLVESFGSWGGNYHMLHFLLGGPPEKLIDLEFLDAKGELISTSGKSVSNGREITYYLDSEPGKDWTLRALLETSKSVKSVPFNFNEIRLP